VRRGRFSLRVAPELSEVRRHPHPAVKRLLDAAVTRVMADPHGGKPLTLELAEYWSWRAGRYRLIYRIRAGRTVELVAFGSRRMIYEETSRFVAKEIRR
jgi:mRNA-degrading endonuclease RelE of RelBE toxin-antitoxin system